MTERGLKNINVFYSTFTNVFYFFFTFFTFLTFFYFSLERFLHLWAGSLADPRERLTWKDKGNVLFQYAKCVDPMSIMARFSFENISSAK